MEETKTPTKRQYWLLKTEPGEWSWADQTANAGKSTWDGVRNKQAIKYLKSMKLGDQCFFYHSGNKSRKIVGVVQVVKECYEYEDGVAVDVEAVGEMRREVALGELKEDEVVRKVGFGLLRQPRLSVVPVQEVVWERVCELGCGFDGDGRVVDVEEGASRGDIE
ncbi:hypothetical protein vseg_009419 [Gypsophila vaccaria]